MAEGWMYKFADGPLGGKTFGPTQHDPPDRVVAVAHGGGVAVADRRDITVDEMPAGAALYERRTQSQLPPQTKESFVIRGAEYTQVEEN